MNPEFQRQLYLEFSFSRLIGMPAFLGVIFALTYLIDDKQLGETTTNTAIFLYILMVFFWGGRQSADSLFEEIKNRTWDIQKTSAISPWSLTWGKLFGSTIFSWYGGFFCLLIYTFATPEPEYISMTWAYALLTGLFVHSLSLLFSVFALRNKRVFNPTISYLFVLFVLFTLIPLLGISYKEQAESVFWYGITLENSQFLALSLSLACLWMLIGIYRLLAEELQIRTLPWLWLAFITFAIFYISGFFIGLSLHESSESHVFIILLLVSFGVCSVLTYLLLFMDNNNPMSARRLWVYAQQSQWLRFLEELPCWVISLILSIPSALLLTAILPIEEIDGFMLYPLVIFLLMLRDIGIVLFFNYASNPKRSLGLSILYLVLLYGIIPSIFFTAGAEVIGALFFPLLTDNLLLALIFASIQVGIISLLLFQRWQKRVIL